MWKSQANHKLPDVIFWVIFAALYYISGQKLQVAMRDMQFPLSDIKHCVIFAAQYYILGQNCKFQCQICSFHSRTLKSGSSALLCTIFWVKIATCNAISKFPLPDLIFWVIFAAHYNILGQNQYLQYNIPVSTPRPNISGQNRWMQFDILVSNHSLIKLLVSTFYISSHLICCQQPLRVVSIPRVHNNSDVRSTRADLIVYDY